MKALFPQLVRFLNDERDQVEFMQLAAELGLGSADVELAKLLVALQIYKGYYADIPRQIKMVHEEALAEMHRVRDEVESISNRASSDAVKIGQWVEDIRKALKETEPTKLAAQVHNRLLDDTAKLLTGSLQTLNTAYRQIGTATQEMDFAAYQAAAAIQSWQTVSLRRVWASAFVLCLLTSLLLLTAVWCLFLRHQAWWISLQ